MSKIIKYQSIYEKRFQYNIVNNREDVLSMEFQHGDVLLVNNRPKIVRKCENTKRGDYHILFADGTQAIFVYYNKNDSYDFMGEWKILERK